MIAVATEWPLSGQLYLRQRVDHAIWVRNVFAITVIRLQIACFRARGWSLTSRITLCRITLTFRLDFVWQAGRRCGAQ